MKPPLRQPRSLHNRRPRSETASHHQGARKALEKKKKKEWVRDTYAVEVKLDESKSETTSASTTAVTKPSVKGAIPRRTSPRKRKMCGAGTGSAEVQVHDESQEPMSKRVKHLSFHIVSLQALCVVCLCRQVRTMKYLIIALTFSPSYLGTCQTARLLPWWTRIHSERARAEWANQWPRSR
jgi:hypothetical protein